MKLQIKFNNDAMQTLEDLAVALRNVALKLEAWYSSGIILDTNGNCVGDWRVQA
jgi:hypothetical protein